MKTKSEFESFLKGFYNNLKVEKLIKTRVKLHSGSLYYRNRFFLDLKKFKKVGIVATGKNSIEMAESFQQIIPDSKILVITPENNQKYKNANFKIIESSHPYISQKSFEAGKCVLDFVSKFSKNDLIIFLISGGSSALVEKTQPGINNNQIVEINNALLSSDFSIIDINILRQSLSDIKGGGLLNYISAQTVSFIISDIAGGCFEKVGSGISVYTVKNRMFYNNAIKILNKLQISPVLKNNLTDFLNKKKNNIEIKHGQEKTTFVKLAQPSHALETFSTTLKEYSYFLKNGLKDFNSNLDEFNKLFSGECRKLCKNEFFAISGEVLYSISDKKGSGGRIQHTMLSNLDNVSDDTIIGGIATDGVDGVTPEKICGVYINKEIKNRILEYDFKKALDDFNSYEILNKCGALVKNSSFKTSNFADIYFTAKIKRGVRPHK
ncbi:MAG: DUF4147 domain-containing protein [Candidatus Muiribacteriota bacterium]